MINKAILIGNVGKTAEIKYTPSGDAVANFSMATSRSWKNSSGEWNTKTDWHFVVGWRRLAEYCEKYVKVGKQVYVEGRIETRNWESGGVTHYRTEIVADKIRLLGKKDEPDTSTREYNETGQQNEPPQEPPGGQTPKDGIPF
jgi:single-strand DNA-binding protein